MKNKSYRKITLSSIVAIFVAFASPVAALGANSVDQIVTALLPETSESRGLQRAETVATTSAIQSGAMPTAKLVVGFVGDGHILTMEGMRQLRTLAKALEDPRLSSSQFQIRAFAYTPNAPAAAQPISSRRAQAVFEHLQGFYGVGVDKILGVQGLGATELNSADPIDPLNQRIEIVNISAR